MDLGKLVFEKPANEVLQDQRIRELYLGKAAKQ
jgi:ABC-type branched-subunit amino acid transport system ATPase component